MTLYQHDNHNQMLSNPQASSVHLPYDELQERCNLLEEKVIAAERAAKYSADIAEQALSSRTELAVKNDCYIREIRNLEQEVNELRQTKFRRFSEEECWIFDEDNFEENHLESLVCPVVINAKYLLNLKTLLDNYVKFTRLSVLPVLYLIKQENLLLCDVEKDIETAKELIDRYKEVR